MVGNEKRIFFKRSVYSRYLFIKRVYNAEVACANYLVTKATTCSPVYKYIYIYMVQFARKVEPVPPVPNYVIPQEGCSKFVAFYSLRIKTW